MNHLDQVPPDALMEAYENAAYRYGMYGNEEHRKDLAALRAEILRRLQEGFNANA